jgi:hypothetical protein
VREEGHEPAAQSIEPDRLYLPVAASQRTYSPLAGALASMQSTGWRWMPCGSPGPRPRAQAWTGAVSTWVTCWACWPASALA